MKERLNLRQALVFAILMGAGEEIKGRSPDYVLEKLGAVSDHAVPEVMLDSDNIAVFESYRDAWAYMGMCPWDTQCDYSERPVAEVLAEQAEAEAGGD